MGADATDIVLEELRRVREELHEVRCELSALRVKVQRPDLQKYTIEEAARRMGRSRSSVYEEIRAKRLAAILERGRRFVTEESVQSWERHHRG